MVPVLSVAVFYKSKVWNRLYKLLVKIDIGVLTRLPSKKHQTGAVVFWIEIIVYIVAQVLYLQSD